MGVLSQTVQTRSLLCAVAGYKVFRLQRKLTCTQSFDSLMKKTMSQLD